MDGTEASLRVGMTRREALKRGALGGLALWTVPAVQVLSLSPASADVTSGGTPTPTATCYDDLPSEGAFLVTKSGVEGYYGVKWANGVGITDIGANDLLAKDLIGMGFTTWSNIPDVAKVFTASTTGNQVQIPVPTGYALVQNSAIQHDGSYGGGKDGVVLAGTVTGSGGQTVLLFKSEKHVVPCTS